MPYDDENASTLTIPSDPAAIRTDRIRDRCNVCDHVFDPERDALASVPCHVRAFADRSFRLWRCSECRTIHCMDVVDLDYYYSRYPFTEAKLDLVWRIFYRNLARRFLRHGMNRSHNFLDYGCANGLFCIALRERGFKRIYGYDPYGDPEKTGDAGVLDAGPFDYILLQDVIEHVEDPEALLQKMDALLAPGGHILVGTPNAGQIDPTKPGTFPNELHAPYHLHIYTRAALESMGRNQGWRQTAFYDRSYHDRPWFGMNTRAAKYYQSMKDGSFDVFFQPFDLKAALLSPTWCFYAVFGYWLSYKSDMSIMFRKPG